MNRLGLDRRRLGYLAVASVATVAGAYGSPRVAAVTKPLPIAMLAASVYAGRAQRSKLDTALLAASLVCSAAGDRAMLLEEFTESDDSAKDAHLRRGASFFAGTQLSYSALLARRGARPRARQLVPRLVVLAESAVVIAIHRPRLRPVLGAYGNTLAMMSALAADARTGQPGLRTGGLLFVASDFTILNRRHLLHHQGARSAAELWVLASYFAAQALLVEGLSRPA